MDLKCNPLIYLLRLRALLSGVPSFRSRKRGKKVSSTSRNRKSNGRHHNGEGKACTRTWRDEEENRKNNERRGNGSRRMEQKSDLLLFFYASFVFLKCLLCTPHYSLPPIGMALRCSEKETGNRKLIMLCAFRKLLLIYLVSVFSWREKGRRRRSSSVKLVKRFQWIGLGHDYSTMKFPWIDGGKLVRRPLGMSANKET